MKRLILNPTDVSQWHSLVLDACGHCHAILPEDIESYLVFMLMRHTQNAQLSSTIVALEYLESYQYIGSYRTDSLRTVGDKCLLLSGLFPDLAERRRVNIAYYVAIGKSAYYHLAHEGSQTLFENLYLQFEPMQEVLQAMRHLPVRARA